MCSVSLVGYTLYNCCALAKLLQYKLGVCFQHTELVMAYQMQCMCNYAQVTCVKRRTASVMACNMRGRQLFSRFIQRCT